MSHHNSTHLDNFLELGALEDCTTSSLLVSKLTLWDKYMFMYVPMVALVTSLLTGVMILSNAHNRESYP